MLSITFGILTDNKQEQVNRIIESIETNKIPDFEIIVVGDVKVSKEYIVVTDTSLEDKNYITQKKNIVIDRATKEIIVLIKDYIQFDSKWYEGLLKYDRDTDGHYDIVMNEIRNTKGARYLDWIWDNPILGNGRNIDYKIKNHPGMFVPGAMVIAKNYVLKKHKFNTSMIGLNKATDIDWSKRALKEFTYTFNPHSKCVAFGKGSNRYPKFRRKCVCDFCSNKSNT